MELIKFDIQKFSGEFNTMTQGIDEAGIDQIYSKIHTWLDQNAKMALDNYLGFFNALDEGWVGSDKEVYKENLKTAIRKIEEKWDECDKLIKEQFETIKQNWHTFESTHIVEK